MVNIVCFDIESTGIDVFEDRVVTATITEMTPEGEIVVNTNWLLDPGVEIPVEASAVHGVSTSHAKMNGLQASTGLTEIADRIRLYYGHPLVIMNANYDVSLLTYELERHGLEPVDWTRFNIIDPLVLDRALDKWRKGGRKLVNLAAHYGVEVDESKAHDSEYDNYLAGNVAIALVRKYKITNGFLKTQAKLYRDWADGFEKYKQKTDPSFRMESKEWPLRTRVAQPE